MAQIKSTGMYYDDATGVLTIVKPDGLKVGGNVVSQGLTVSSGLIDANNDTDRFIFTADRAYQVTKIEFQQSVIENTSATTTVMLEKVPSGTAIGSGTDLMAAALNLKTGVVANTVLSAGLHATAANLQLAAGDSIGLDFTNALTEYVGSCTVTLKAI